MELKLKEKLLLFNTAEPAGFEKIEEILPAIQEAMEVSGPSLIEYKMSLELNTSTTTISQLQMKINN